MKKSFVIVASTDFQKVPFEKEVKVKVLDKSEFGPFHVLFWFKIFFFFPIEAHTSFLFLFYRN